MVQTTPVVAAVLFAACTLAPAQPMHEPRPMTLAAPVARWDEGIPLGNGVVGALLYGEGRTLKIALDRGDLWDTRVPATIAKKDWTYATMRRLVREGNFAELNARFDVPYDTIAYPTKLPAGRLELVFADGVKAESLTLDLARAESHADWGSSKVRAVVHDDVILVEIEGSLPELKLVRPKGLDLLAYAPAAERAGDQEASFSQPTHDGKGFTVLAGWRKQPNPSGDRWLFAVAITPDLNPSPARTRVQAALDNGYAIAQNKVAQAVAPVWSRSRVVLPDERLQGHYDLCKYLLFAGNAPGAPAMPLQGLWTADEGGLPPWKGDYHNDLNTQTTYISCLPSGQTEASETFLSFNTRLLPRYQRFATEFYDVPGAVVPGVMAIDGAPLGGWAQYSLSPTNGAWIAQLYYLHWRYTQDSAFLRETAFPFCQQNAVALLSLLTPDSRGYLRLPLSSSPEIFDNSPRAWLAPNSTYDQSLLRWLFAACAEMAEALHPAHPGDGAKWREALAKLEPLDTDPATGSLTFVRGIPFAESHRHFSHAMAVHPLGLLHAEGTEGDKANVRATLDTIEKHGTSQWTGYSFAWFACMAARAGEGDRALKHLSNYERAFISRNGFHLNGDQTKSGLSNFTYRPFTLEGNFLAMQAVHEMLLQSWGEVGRADSSIVRIFPATPGTWSDCAFDGLRAEGGFAVSAERAGGLTTRVRVVANTAGVLRLRDPFKGSPARWSRTDFHRTGDLLTISMKAGDVLDATRGE